MKGTVLNTIKHSNIAGS